MKTLEQHVETFVRLNERLREATAYAEAEFLNRFNNLSVMQVQVIRTIAFHNPCTMTQIAKGTHLTKGNITQLIDKLETLGYVHRARSKTDRRVVYVVLTNQGQEVAEASRQQVATVARAVLSRFTPEEQAQFIAFFERMAHNA